MKTTVDLDPELLKAAKRCAIDEGTTLRALVEDGLRERLKKPPPEPELSGPERAAQFLAFMARWDSEHPAVDGPGTDSQSIIDAIDAGNDERAEHLMAVQSEAARQWRASR